MDQHQEYQEPIPKAIAQLSEGMHTKLLKHANNFFFFLSKFEKTDSIKNLCRPMEMGGNRCWRLGLQESEDSEIEEVVLRIQGVVCNRDLPPIRSPFKMYVIIIWVVATPLIPQQTTQ